MPSAFTHAAAAVALGTVIVPGRARLIALGAVCSALPDLDVIGFRIGIRYDHMLGHRGLSHSLAFAAVLAALATWLAARPGERPALVGRLALFSFVAAASHGLLDAITNGGLGVAFFAPLSAERYFFPWRPIVVSPISLRRFFSGRGAEVVTSELLIVWVPAAVVCIAGVVVRRARARRSSS